MSDDKIVSFVAAAKKLADKKPAKAGFKGTPVGVDEADRLAAQHGMKQMGLQLNVDPDTLASAGISEDEFKRQLNAVQSAANAVLVQMANLTEEQSDAGLLALNFPTDDKRIEIKDLLKAGGIEINDDDEGSLQAAYYQVLKPILKGPLPDKNKVLLAALVSQYKEENRAQIVSCTVILTIATVFSRAGKFDKVCAAILFEGIAKTISNL